MTVGELISRLKFYNPEIEVVCIGKNEQLLKIQNNPYELGNVNKVTLLYSGELQIASIED